MYQMVFAYSVVYKFIFYGHFRLLLTEFWSTIVTIPFVNNNNFLMLFVLTNKKIILISICVGVFVKSHKLVY